MLLTKESIDFSGSMQSSGGGNKVKKVTKEAIHDVLSGILGAQHEQARNCAVYEVLEADQEALDPSSFFFRYKYPVGQAMESLIAQKVTGFESSTDRYQFSEVFTAYEDFYHPHLAAIFCEMEGSPFSSDKAGFVLSSYLRGLRNKDDSVWDKGSYFVPNTGDKSDWMDLCKALVQLRFGKDAEYVACREKLNTKKAKP